MSIAATFGPTAVPTYAIENIQVSYVRGDAIETQDFSIMVKPVDMGTVYRLLLASNAADEEALTGMVRMISQYMSNTDGVSATWEYKELKPKPETPDQINFRAPNGKIVSIEHAAKFLDPAKGSSRRRWLHLMNQDDGAEIDVETIQRLLQYLTEVAAKRPTPASS